MLRKFSAIIAALLAVALAPAPAQAGSFSALYAFGDSLSDVGNFFAATGGAAPAPPYVNGRFSNGPVWVDYLSKQLNLAPVVPSLAGGNDYAYGYATTGFFGANPYPFVLNGDQQVNTFLKAQPSGAAPSTGLYTFTLGSNDLFDILTALQGGLDPATAATDVAGAAKTEAQEITTLAGAGAKTFIVSLVPDLGLTPGILALKDPLVAATATSLASNYNAALEYDLATSPDASLLGGVHFLNTFAWLDDAVKDPTSVGLPSGTNVTDPCYPGDYTGGGSGCSNPNEYLFWDQVHPTTTVDAILAADAAALLAPSPTPGVGLASLGLLLLIGLKRKRA
jgi:phospholipase/lecithinase/hemolysin